MRLWVGIFFFSLFVVGKIQAEDRKPLVITSFSILEDMVRNVGGSAVEVKSLVGRGEDIHGYHPKAKDFRELSRAKLFFVNGLGLDAWSRLVLESKSFQGKTILATTGIATLKGDHGADPHAWQDPRNGLIYVKNIENALVQLLPDKAAEIQERSQSYQAQIKKVYDELETGFQKIPSEKRKMISSHDAFAYFAKAFQIQVIPSQGWTTEIEPTAAQVARVIQQIRAQKISVLFLENLSSGKLIRQISRETGAKVGGELFSDTLNEKGPASTYLGLLKANGETVLSAFTQQ